MLVRSWLGCIEGLVVFLLVGRMAGRGAAGATGPDKTARPRRSATKGGARAQPRAISSEVNDQAGRPRDAPGASLARTRQGGRLTRATVLARRDKKRAQRPHLGHQPRPTQVPLAPAARRNCSAARCRAARA
eukprot:12665665-Alexandrium_andersonii.AAC.1